MTVVADSSSTDASVELRKLRQEAHKREKRGREHTGFETKSDCEDDVFLQKVKVA